MTTASLRFRDNITRPPAHVIPSVMFYSIEVGQAADGALIVSVCATTSEGEGELENMDLGQATVGTIAAVLATVERALTFGEVGRMQ